MSKRAIRILLVVVVILGGLFVAADRLAVNFAEDEAAEKLRSNEGLSEAPDVSIKGFPFLTQVAGGELDDVEVGIKDYDAKSGADSIRIADLTAHMKGVKFSGDYSSATAATASGTARVSYDELLKAGKSEPVDLPLGAKGEVVGLSDGGNGKIKLEIEVSKGGAKLPKPVYVLSSVRVEGDNIKVHADEIPKKIDVLGVSIPLPEAMARDVTDFEQKIDDLPAGIKLEKVEAAPDGVDMTVTGENVSLTG
ncbi:LmeA family phospholipid-binding protein [Streptomyces flavofungini]|uniref:LmeA family phospholipid-binding protein n=1 Tax=Streptomyces flavofungini TaxID=68200 RepID=UPI0034DE4A8B